MKRLLAAIILVSCLVQLSIQQQCSSSKLCPAGCCSSAGYCGYGPEYCGKGCQSTCDRKADCNPGWDGSDWSKTDKCPLNVCCSKHGFCGFTEEFCEGNEVKRPSCSPGDTPVDRVIGYYESWSTAKRPCYAMGPEEIPFGQYTHIIFSFATINPATFEISPGNEETEDVMSRIGAIKLLQPDIKIWVAVGGWAFNDPGPTQTTFSDIAASKANTDKFLNSLARMMNKYDFDGVDIDWEYPEAPDRHGRGEDYKNIVTFMQALRDRMTHMRKGVSMAIPASYWYLQHFDIVELEKTVDWFNLMTYDVHGAWDIDNKFTGPWANAHTNLTEIQQGLDLLWRNDINPKKVTMGMSYYSRSFTLTDPGCSTPGCRVSSAGVAGKCSGTAGVLLHPEIQDVIKENGLKPTLYRDAAVKTVSWGNQWVSFDDVVTWRLKANSLRSQCITGFMVWAISQDDKSGTNAKALVASLGRPKMDFPDFNSKTETPEPVTDGTKSCRWTSCFEGCPSGFKEVQRNGHKEIMMDTSRCRGFSHGFTRFCCPSDDKQPTCSWRGHANSGKCSPGCKPGEVEVGTLHVGCKSKYQSACCTETSATALYGKCMWLPCSKNYGKDMCGGKFSYYLAASSIGSGGIKSCSKNQKATLCCTQPPPNEVSGTCKWVKKAGFLNGERQSLVCEGACPTDQFRIALEDGLTIGNEGGEGCFGDMAYCCDKPSPPVRPRDDDDFGSSQAKEFRTLMEKYMENPTCPATVLHPPLHDPFGGSTAETKRSLQVEAREFEILQGRAKDCALDIWVRLLQFSTLIFSMKNQQLDPLRKIWDDKFAANYDTELEYRQLQQFLDDDVSSYEPRGLLEYVLYNPTVAGEGLRRARRATQVFCELPSSRGKRSDQIAAIKPRRIWEWGGVEAGIPGLDTILLGIQHGHLTLHYARWQYQSGQDSAEAEGPLLELAYWIGPNPGQILVDTELDQYRDFSPDQSREEPDRWVVFHLHIDRDSDWLRRINGRTHIGVAAVRFFHGQWVRPAQGEHRWRVQGRGRRAHRDGFNCPRHLGSLWYVGSPRDVPANDIFMQRFQSWGERLFAQGYAAFPALALIFERHDSTANDIDPDNPGTLLIRGDESTTANGGDPYTLNWLWTAHGYDFFPPPPPPGLQ